MALSVLNLWELHHPAARGLPRSSPRLSRTTTPSTSARIDTSDTTGVSATTPELPPILGRFMKAHYSRAILHVSSVSPVLGRIGAASEKYRRGQERRHEGRQILAGSRTLRCDGCCAPRRLKSAEEHRVAGSETEEASVGRLLRDGACISSQRLEFPLLLRLGYRYLPATRRNTSVMGVSLPLWSIATTSMVMVLPSASIRLTPLVLIWPFSLAMTLTA